ncbi:imelysin family protein [Microbaculum marinisediminis]|uniref:Imelysin-like domain-containing protein n=1 Tax=Microbaculum marinisediminis TaxID=2931392 RepID=A0AAW5QV06_9HYPH|nr:imelysin family protein [Microbaculum sp. A6E488]MCT8970739.1 hypothetical protein [Microbaculum sp. A6E488]
MRRALCAVLLCLWATGASAGMPDNLGQRITDGFVRPSVTQFANTAAVLSGDIDRLCREPSEPRLDTVRQRFDTLVEAWFRIFFLRFGPMVVDNRFEKIFFWPDPRGVVLRQVGAILAGPDADAIDPAKLAAKSVAVQGLPALEFLLFGTGSPSLLDKTDEGRFRCAYALSASVVLSERAAAIVADWGPDSAFVREIAHPGPNNDIYRNDQEVAAEVVKALAGGTAFLAEVVIVPFLGKEPEQANYRKAPLWRSGSTIRAVRGGLAGLRDFYAATGIGEALSAPDRWIDGGLRLEMRKILDTLDKLDMPLDEAVRPGPGREALIYTVIALKSLHTTMDTRLAQAVGVSVGFNALDGD